MAKATDKKQKKAKDSKKKSQGSSSPEGIRLADHPRARLGIAKARAMGGMAGLALAAFAANGGGLPPFDVGVRALIGGMIGSLLAWAVAVVVWRQVAVAEIKAAHAKRSANAKMLAEAQQAVES